MTAHQTEMANIFVKNPAIYERFQLAADARGLTDFPEVSVIADVCRDDLLFEIDL